MKISDLIQDIIDLAENKFDATAKQPGGHINDCISVYIYFAGVLGTWQVGLERPSREQLDCGEVEDCDTTKSTINRVAFYTEANTLLNALRDLHDKVQAASSFEFEV